MAKVVNTFVKGKLNKDLDARLVPNGEYRDARNVQISKSEGPDVGELENVLGNEITSLTWSGNTRCIGWVVDEAKSFAYLFLTDNQDEAYDTTKVHQIIQYNVATDTAIDLIFTGGTNSSFLNFSQLNPIYGVNILENLLFWTDNRNQPRKINIERAVADPRYYQTEDQISVAKYSPYQPFQLWQESTLSSNSYPNNYETTMKNVTELFLPGGGSAQCDGPWDGAAGTDNIKNLEGSYQLNQKIYYVDTNGDIQDTLSTVLVPIVVAGATVLGGGAAGQNQFTDDPLLRVGAITSGMVVSGPAGVIAAGTTLVSITPDPITGLVNVFTLSNNIIGAGLAPGDTLTFSGPRDPNKLLANPVLAAPLPNNTKLIFGTPNEYYNPDFSGDPAFLDDKFVRFSYRFRYDDNEYSIFAPFTQPAFIPEQDGYFLYEVGGFPSIVKDDQADAYRSTVVQFMENKVEDITLIMPLPFSKFNLKDKLKLKDVDILYKESDGLAVRVLDTISIEEIENSSARAQVNPAVVASDQITLNPNSIRGTINVGDIITSKSIDTEVTVVSFDAATSIITASSNVDLPNSAYVFIGDQYTYSYNYVSKKPIKTLPDSEITRVFDKIPVKAFSQEVAGNRVIYGNYLNKHTPPEFIDYNVNVSQKAPFEIREGTAQVNGNQTLTAGSLVLTIKNWTPSPGVTDIEIGDDILDSNGTFLAKVQAVGTAVSPNTEVTFDRLPIGLTNPNVFLDDQLLTFTDPGTVNQRTSKVEYPNHSLKQNRNYQVGIVLSDRFGRQSSVILSNNKEATEAEGSTFIGDTVYSAYISPGVNKITFPGESLKVLFNNPIGPTANSNFAWPGIYNGDKTSPDYNPLGWYSYKIVVKQTEQEYYNVYLPGIMASYPEDTTLELDSSSHVVLINDNINKVPRDLNEVGPDQKQFRSSVRLFGRVQNTTTPIDYQVIVGTNRIKSDNIGLGNEQYYPERTGDTASTISTMNDLFEYNPTNPPQPNFFPQFYQFDSNPLIARISTQNEIGQPAETNYFPASAQIPTDQDNVGEPPPGNPVEISSVSGTPLPGMLVTGRTIPENTYVGTYTQVAAPANDELTLIKLDGATTQLVTVKEGDILYFTPTKDVAGAYPLLIPGIQYLSVYETEPVVSNLDIFWETTTTGLIQDLNDFILNETSGGSTLFPVAATSFTEGLGAAPQNVFDLNFKVVDQFGITLDPLDFSIIDVVLSAVVDGNNPGNNVSNFFNLTAGNQTTGWNVTTTAPFYNSVFYGNDAAARNFVFTFTVTTQSITAAIPPTVVSTQIPVSLFNVGPTLLPVSTTIQTNRSITSSLQTITAVNGANNPNLSANDLTISIYDIVKDGTSMADAGIDLTQFFVLDPSPAAVVGNQRSTDLKFASPPPPVADYVVKVRAADAGLDDEEDYSIPLNLIDAVKDKKVLRIAYNNPDGDEGAECPVVSAIQIEVDASPIAGQNGKYLFIGYQGANFNDLTNDTDTITIDRTNAFVGSAGPNCNAPSVGGGGSSFIFYYTAAGTFGDLRNQAKTDNCTLYTDQCEGSGDWEIDPTLPNSLAIEYDISNYLVEII